MESDVFAACAEQLAAQPDLVDRLLRDHAPTPDGLCSAHDAHPERHPCSIRILAELAARIVAQQSG